MTYPHRPGAVPSTRVETGRWTARRADPARRPQVPSRRYEAMALIPGEGIVDIVRAGPAHPIFEANFAALGRGALLASEDGPVAVEDLLPGMRVETRDAGFQTVLWVGSIALAPQSVRGHAPAELYRIPAESFGPARPAPDLVLAPHARLLHRSPRFSGIARDGEVLAPVQAFEDGASVIRVTPAAPVRVYHLAFREHHVLRANGLEIESVHPGEGLGQQLSAEGLRSFLSFFPQLDAQAGFGRLRVPRISLEEFEALTAA